MRGQQFRQPAFKCRQPGELVVVFVAADFLAVGHIGTDDAQIAYRCRDQALLRVREPRILADDIGEAVTREDGDAVIGFLSGEGHGIAGGLDFRAREGAVLGFRFLQADDIGLAVGEPLKELRQADLERVDVPAGDFHCLKIPEGLAP